jgi:hypothetical protein
MRDPAVYPSEIAHAIAGIYALLVVYETIVLFYGIIEYTTLKKTLNDLMIDVAWYLIGINLPMILRWLLS